FSKIRVSSYFTLDVYGVKSSTIESLTTICSKRFFSSFKKANLLLSFKVSSFSLRIEPAIACVDNVLFLRLNNFSGVLETNVDFPLSYRNVNVSVAYFKRLIKKYETTSSSNRISNSLDNTTFSKSSSNTPTVSSTNSFHAFG